MGARHARRSRRRPLGLILVAVISTGIVAAGTALAGTVTVQPGDTLYSLSQRFLGNGALWPKLYAANRNIIGANPDLVYAGERLAVPGKSAGMRPAPPRIATPAGIEPGLTGIARFLEQHGYSRAGAAGIAGDVWGESGGRPESVGDGGCGLIGWTPCPPGLVTGNPVTDLRVQLDGILQYDVVNDNGHLAAVKHATDPVTASRLYSKYFERPAVLYSDVYPAVTLAVYAQL